MKAASASILLGLALSGCSSETPEGSTESNDTSSHAYGAQDPVIRYSGRFDLTNTSFATTSAPAASATIRFEGVGATILLDDQFQDGKKNYFSAVVDHGEPVEIVPNRESIDYRYPVASDLPYGEHSVTVFKKTEASLGFTRFMGFEVAGTALPAAAALDRKIEIIGDSISTGAGVEAKDGSELCGASHPGEADDASRAYGPLLSESLNAEFHVTAASGRGLVRNYSTREDPRPIPEIYDLLYTQQTSSETWDTSKFVPDAILIALGTNDFSPGDPGEAKTNPRARMTADAFTTAYVSFIETLRGYYPNAHVFLLSSPMLVDGEPDSTYTSLSDQKASLTAVESEFVSRGDAMVTTIFLDQRTGSGCDTHPDLKQQQEMAAELEPIVKSAMGW